MLSIVDVDLYRTLRFRYTLTRTLIKYRIRQNLHERYLHCVQKKTPTHIFFHISINYVWILTKIAVNIPKD